MVLVRSHHPLCPANLFINHWPGNKGLSGGQPVPGFVSGYMTQIPSEWPVPLRRSCTDRDCCNSILSVQSNGPAASVFNPSNVGVVNPVPATPWLAILPASPEWLEYHKSYFNGTTELTGIVFPSGRRACCSSDAMGWAPSAYGGGAECNDPADSSKGTHAYPYKYQSGPMMRTIS